MVRVWSLLSCVPDTQIVVDVPVFEKARVAHLSYFTRIVSLMSVYLLEQFVVSVPLRTLIS